MFSQVCDDGPLRFGHDCATELLEFEKKQPKAKLLVPSRAKASKKASKYTDEELSTMDMLVRHLINTRCLHS